MLSETRSSFTVFKSTCKKMLFWQVWYVVSERAQGASSHTHLLYWSAGQHCGFWRRLAGKIFRQSCCAAANFFQWLCSSIDISHTLQLTLVPSWNLTRVWQFLNQLTLFPDLYVGYFHIHEKVLVFDVTVVVQMALYQRKNVLNTKSFFSMQIRSSSPKSIF